MSRVIRSAANEKSNRFDATLLFLGSGAAVHVHKRGRTDAAERLSPVGVSVVGAGNDLQPKRDAERESSLRECVREPGGVSVVHQDGHVAGQDDNDFRSASVGEPYFNQQGRARTDELGGDRGACEGFLAGRLGVLRISQWRREGNAVSQDSGLLLLPSAERRDRYHL